MKRAKAAAKSRRVDPLPRLTLNLEIVGVALLAIAAYVALALWAPKSAGWFGPGLASTIGVWYASVDDLAHALGGGASFDASKRTLYASAGDRYSQQHMVDRVGGGFATDGTIAVRLVSVKKSMSFQGNAPDPGAHFIIATMQLKNLTSAPVAMYDVQTSMVKSGQHVNDGQFYDTAGHDLSQTDVSPGQTVTYLDVFEINDDIAADGILVHPPFAPTTRPVDMVLKL